jgi:hypothetical protein
MAKKLVYLLAMFALTMLSLTAAPARVAACSGTDCGCEVGEASCVAFCQAAYPSGSTQYNQCNIACVRAYVRCAVACCSP